MLDARDRSVVGARDAHEPDARRGGLRGLRPRAPCHGSSAARPRVPSSTAMTSPRNRLCGVGGGAGTLAAGSLLASAFALPESVTSKPTSGSSSSCARPTAHGGEGSPTAAEQEKLSPASRATQRRRREATSRARAHDAPPRSARAMNAAADPACPSPRRRGRGPRRRGLDVAIRSPAVARTSVQFELGHQDRDHLEALRSCGERAKMRPPPRRARGA